MTVYSLNNLDKAIEKYKHDADEAVRAVILAATHGVTEKTPVDSGRAKGSWVASLDAPSSVIPENYETSPLGVEADQSQVFELLPNVVGRKFYFVNNLPYIRRLEYDRWSQQAPAGMVRITLGNIQRNIDQIIKD